MQETFSLAHLQLLHLNDLHEHVKINFLMWTSVSHHLGQGRGQNKRNLHCRLKLWANTNGAGGSGGILSSKMPLDWLKIGLNLVKKIVTVFENTTGKLIEKSSSPLKNCCNLVVKDLKSVSMLYANTSSHDVYWKTWPNWQDHLELCHRDLDTL